MRTNGIESFWALLKRGYYDIDHHMSEAHRKCCIDEFISDHNICQQVTGMVGKRLTCKELMQ